MKKRTKHYLFINFKLLFFLPLLICLYTSPIRAQDNTAKKINGKVTDEKGAPLSGVTVSVKGENNVTTTSKDGSFLMSVNADVKTLVFTYVGMETQQVDIGSKTYLQIKLQPTENKLGDVIVIGYGTARKKDLTGANVVVSGEKLQERSSSPNPIVSLTGLVPGLQIMNNSGVPNGKLNVSMRGLGSINASNAPLWVVDGVIGYDPTFLSQNEIQSLVVLKDASATAIYGSRGANGVIIVTTKKAKSGPVKVEFDYSTSRDKMAREIEMANAEESVEIQKRYYEYEGLTFPDLHATYPRLFGPDQKPLYDVDWQKLATRTAKTNRYALSITGGTEKSRTGLFLNYVSNEGILLNTDMKKYNARLTNDLAITPWLDISSQLSASSFVTNVFGGEVTRMMLEMSPMIPLTYPDGKHGSQGDSYAGWNPDNPVDMLNSVKDRTWNTLIAANTTVNAKLTKDLTFSTTASVTFNPTTRKYFAPGIPYFNDGWSNPQGNASFSTGRSFYWQSENFVTYKKTLGKHSFTGLIGASWNNSVSDGFSASNSIFSDPILGFYNIGAGQTTSVPVPSSNYSEMRMNSYFSRLNYSFDSKYLVTVTGRYDGSSRFGSNNQYAFFPSAALAWVASEEDFLKNSSISNLKFRASYGLTGNSEIGNYSTQSLIRQGKLLLDNRTMINYAYPSNSANPDLKWETTGQTNVGVDIGLFQQKVTLTADYFMKNTKDLLFNKPTSIVSGFSSVLTNIGNTKNKGIELQLASNNIQLANNFTWSALVNYFSYKNKVTKLGLKNEDVFTNSALGGSAQIIRVGESLGSYYTYKRLGIWGTDEAAEAATYGQRPGEPKRWDVNKDGKINNADKLILGNAMPKYEMMISNTFSYKNLSLTADIRIVQGNKNLFYNIVTQEDRAIFGNSFKRLYTDGWTPTHQNTMVVSPKGAWDGNIDSYYLEDGSFIRGQNLILSYGINDNVVKKLGVGSIRFYANASNFFLITKYRGWDPEVNNYGDSFGQGMEFNAYPKSKSYTIGVNVKF